MTRPGFILLLLLPFKLLAQPFTPNPDWRFENFNSQNHFVSLEISALTIDKNGYVWTSGVGLQRFDGYRTTEFNSFDQAKRVLRSNYTCVIGDNKDRVWINAGGLCYYDNASGKFIYMQPDANHHLTRVEAFFVQENYLWFICEYGLAKLNLQSLKISFTPLKHITDALCIYPTDENNLLISSREKVYMYNIKENTYTTQTLLYNHALVKIFSVITCRSDIFLGTNYGLFTLKNLKDVSPANKGTDVVINDLLFFPQDKEKKYLFIASEGKGLMIYNTVLKKMEFTYEHDVNNPYSLPNNIISKLFVDKKERLWLGTDFGISMLDVYNQQLKMRFINKNNADVLGINKIARDKYDSTKVWMASYNQGMICVNWKTKRIEKIFDTNPKTRQIYDFVQLSKNKWLLA